MPRAALVAKGRHGLAGEHFPSVLYLSMWRNESKSRGVNCTIMMSSSSRVYCSNKIFLHENRKKIGHDARQCIPVSQTKKSRSRRTGRNGRPFLDLFCCKVHHFRRFWLRSKAGCRCQLKPSSTTIRLSILACALAVHGTWRHVGRHRAGLRVLSAAV